MSYPTYATREAISRAIDIQASAHKAADIDRIAQSVSRQIEQRMHRHFYPLTQTLDYRLGSGGAGFYLDADLLAVTKIIADGTVLTTDDYSLFPARYGPPYDYIEVDGTEISISGVWGYSNDTAPVGTLVGNIDNTVESLVVSDAARVGVGDLIILGTERMVVIERSFSDTTADTDGALTADKSQTTITVTDGNLVNPGETLLIDAERVRVLSVTGNDLQVERAVDGSVLAAHDTGTDLYAERTLTVSRGAAGTSAVSHTDGDAITRNVPPGPIVSLAIAEAVTQLEQESAAYARTIGSGEGEREAAGKGLADIRRQAQHFRRLRMAAV